MDDFLDDLEDALDPDRFDSEEILIFIFVLLGVVLLFGFIAAAMKGAQQQNTQNTASQMQSRWAKVVDRQSLPGNAMLSMSQIWVLFEFADGSRLRLNLPAAQTVAVGDSGTLTWQGDAVISFRHDGVGAPQSQSHSAGAFRMEDLPAWKRVEIMEAKKREAAAAGAAKPAEAADAAEPAEATAEKPAVEATAESKAKANKYCVYCGEPMSEGHMFCGACGKKRG